MLYLSFKALHFIAVVAWFAGLLYLPRLFVYHREAAIVEDTIGVARFRIMESRLYRQIMNPAIAAVFLFGIILLLLNPAVINGAWFTIKFFLVLCLLAFHLACGRYLRLMQGDTFQRSPSFFRWFNEVPALLLIVIVFLAVLKPF